MTTTEGPEKPSNFKCKLSKPRIAVTMGDPAGIGPEICLDLLTDSSIADLCTPIIFGDANVLRLCAEQTDKSADFKEINADDLASATEPCVLNLGLLDPKLLEPGVVNQATGHATYGYVTQAIDACLSQCVHAVTT